MKKKSIKISLITLGIIAVIPISVFAANNIKKLIGPPVVKEQSREEIREKLEKEKQEWENTNKNNAGKSIGTQVDVELQNKNKIIEDATKKAEDIIITALNRIYPNEFPTLLAEIKKLNEKDPSYNLEKITETDYKLYNLIFDAMEINLFKEEEKEVFREFMSDQYNVIKKDQKLQKRCEKLGIK